jgi:V8-like Glu-specific endopeptidase
MRPLDRVTTLGYPKIPFADDAYLAFHSGEVNTVFKTTAGEELFLISNQIGPGSSGGPVMNDKGLLVGVAAKAFQGKMEPDADFLINWNAAITFKRVRKFLQDVSGIEDWSANHKEWLKD